MPLSPALRKDIGNIRKTVLQDRNFSTAKTLIETLLADQQGQTQTYTDEEIALLRHALVHLDSIITQSDEVQFGKLGRILNEDTEKVA